MTVSPRPGGLVLPEAWPRSRLLGGRVRDRLARWGLRLRDRRGFRGRLLVRGGRRGRRLLAGSGLPRLGRLLLVLLLGRVPPLLVLLRVARRLAAAQEGRAARAPSYR